jgi:hypothetical protein
MKNFFRLEVFKNGSVIFDKMVPTMIISQTISQWSGPQLGYSFRLTFDSGRILTSDEVFSQLGGDSFINDFSDELNDEIDLLSQ